MSIATQNRRALKWILKLSFAQDITIDKLTNLFSHNGTGLMEFNASWTAKCIIVECLARTAGGLALLPGILHI